VDLYQQQQFSFFLQTATERFVMRLEERFRGADAALQQLQNDPQAFDTWLNEFTDAVFEDFLLNNIEAACFVLQSLPRRNTGPLPDDTVEQTLVRLARSLFAQLLHQKTVELLEQHAGYQSV